MKWIKTNDRLPTEHKEYIVRLNNTLVRELTFIPGKAEWYLQENVIEWLDETNGTDCHKEIEKYQTEIAEWKQCHDGLKADLERCKKIGTSFGIKNKEIKDRAKRLIYDLDGIFIGALANQSVRELKQAIQ
jgi:hypothetical protein